MAATAPAWRTMLVDSLGAVAMIWMVPVAILVVGAPIVLVVSMILALARRML
jgi:hypothetical protein